MAAAKRGRKAEPQPLEEPRSLERSLARAAAGDPPPKLRIALRVGGGVPGQRYRFDLTAEGSGEVRCELSDQMTDRQARAEGGLEREDLAALARTVQASRVLAVPTEPPRMLPDSLVGILEISEGDDLRRWTFAADPEQAATQDAAPPPEVRKAVDALYSLGGRLTGRRSVKP